MNAHVNNPSEIRDGETIRRAFSGSVIKSINQELRQIEFIISNASVDRYGDIITVSGWDLKMYKQNPVVLFGHLSSIPPIGKSIKTWKEGDALRAIAQFMPADLSPFADSIYRMYLEGYLRAVSVGFRPLKYEPIMDDNGDYTYAYKFIKQELLEFSAVPIPANPEALVAARSKGIDTLPFKSWAEEILDNWKTTEKEVGDIYGMGKKEIENIRRRAAGAGSSIVVPLDIQDALLARNLAAIRRSKEEKAKAVSFETIDIAGEEHEVPVRALKDGEVIGDLTMSKHNEKDGDKEVVTFQIEKADDLVYIDPEVVTEVSGMSVKTHDYEGGSMLCLTIATENREVSYELIGVDAEGKLFASKVKDSATEQKEEPVEPKATPEAETKEEVADVDDEDVDEAADTEVDDQKDAPVVETAHVINILNPKLVEEYLVTAEGEKLIIAAIKKNGYSKPVKGTQEELEVPLDFVTNLSYMERVLCDFEESYEKGKQLTKHEQRKVSLVATQLREIADLLTGEVKTAKEAAPLPVPVKDAINAKEFTNSTDVQKYLNDVMGSLQPMLAEMIGTKLAKMRGRLD
jgi:hypothetical protein